jgi:hypothetical protein
MMGFVDGGNRAKGIVSDPLLQEGKGLVSQISNLKAAAVQKDK